MPYAHLDDRYDDHRKIKRALRREPAAIGFHAMAIACCNRHQSDGEIEIERVDEWLSLTPYRPAQRKRVIDTLLELGLFERKDAETFIVHDFLEWNLSRSQRAKLAEQGRKGGQSRRGGSSPPPSKGSSNGLSEGSSQSGSGGLSTPLHSSPLHSKEETNTSASLRSAVLECFAYWQEKCEHPTAKLTADRRAKITARLREGYTVSDIRKAIDGAARGAFVNDAGRRFDDIELICRNGAKLEGFVSRPVPDNVRQMPGRKESPSDLWRAINGPSDFIEGSAS